MWCVKLLTHLAIGHPRELLPSLPVYTTFSIRMASPFSPYLNRRRNNLVILMVIHFCYLVFGASLQIGCPDTLGLWNLNTCCSLPCVSGAQGPASWPQQSSTNKSWLVRHLVSYGLTCSVNWKHHKDYNRQPVNCQYGCVLCTCIHSPKNIKKRTFLIEPMCEYSRSGEFAASMWACSCLYCWPLFCFPLFHWYCRSKYM